MVTRRGFITAAALGSAAVGTRLTGLAQSWCPPPADGTVRDKLWMFGVSAKATYPHTLRRTVMSPAEGGFYFGVPNMMMIQSNAGKEAEQGRFDSPFSQYAVVLRPFKRVLWSLVGSGGFTTDAERVEGIELVKQTPNFVGVYLDDFFMSKPGEKRAVLTVDQLRDIRQQLKSSGKETQINVTFYTRLLELDLADYLQLIDVITLWTWKAEDLAALESNLERATKLAPNLKTMLGCYLVDFTKKESVPVAAMKHQCETGLKYLKDGRIQGMVFLGNGVMDVGFESVEWTRNWIREVGESRIGS